MGISWSSRRRRNNSYYQNPHPPSQLISSSSSSSSYPYPSEPPYPAPSPYAYPTHHPPPPPLPGPPPPPPPPPIYSSYYYSGGYSACNYANPMVGRSNFVPYYACQTNGWTGMRPLPLVGPPPPPRPQYVDHQHAKKVRNDVNVHKDTLRLEIDEQNPDHHLVSFVFDALFNGSITVFYFAKEEPNCQFVPLYPEAFMPVKIPFQKGLGQKFRQPSGTGIDLGFFALEDLSKQSAEDVFPLVISAETCLASPSTDQHVSEPPPNSSANTQITQAVIEKNNEDPFRVKVIRQILWIDGVRYELREIYGIGSSAAESFNDSDTGKECVICMTEPKDTAVLPCRHMCMCSECAKQLRLQSNKCPICRQPIEELMEIKINNVDQ